MSYEPAEQTAFRQRLLTSPGERQDVDYKASKPLQADDSFTLKLIRHIQGMANMGGGWLVIGMSETPSGFMPDPGHEDRIAATYDPTRLSQVVNSSVARGQKIDLHIFQELNRETGCRHPIIQVIGIGGLPVVCRSTKRSSDTDEAVLRQGAVYLRRMSAETSEVATPEDWEEIINRCVRLRRDDFLAEFRDLFERMMTTTTQATATATGRLDDILQISRARAFG